MAEGLAKVVLQHFGPPWSEPETLLHLTPGGLSGGLVWKVHAAGKSAALRRYPLRFELARVRLLQEVMRQARPTCPFMPELHVAAVGTVVTADDSLWELASWMPGEPALARMPTEAQIVQGVNAIARWHSVPFAIESVDPQHRDGNVPTSIQRRLQEWERLTPMLMRDVVFPTRELAALGKRTRQLVPATQRWFTALREIAPPPGPRRMCLRDVHREHLLFTGNEVTGLIDFGAVGMDLPMGDVARFVGSFDPRGVDAIDGWKVAWSNLPSSFGNAAAGKILAQTLTTVAALHWYEWFRRGDTFRDPEAAQRRWGEILDHLEYWIASS